MTEMRELTIGELDIVTGGTIPDGYTYCSVGTTAGGGSGLYAAGTECSTSSSFIHALAVAARNAVNGHGAA